jgi:tagatose 1,6-diphosphate aldolase
MRTLSIGQIRRLQQCASPRGAISVCALDHRSSLAKLLNPDHPEQVTQEHITDFKVELVHSLAPVSTAVLVDPQVSAAQCVERRVFPADKGMIVAVEASGYAGSTDARQSRVLPGWSVAQTARMGASAVKLLVYYHPDAPTAGVIEELVSQVAEDCQKMDLPLFLEPLSYSLDASRKKLSPDERRRVVIETAQRLTPLGGEVLKAEFPLEAGIETSWSVWLDACQSLSQASRIPWVLLSAGVDYESFLRQLTAACQSGASGVAVGRAVWQEAADLQGQARKDFLQGEVRQRMRRITALVEALAWPWMDFFEMPHISPEWYQGYAA